MSLRDKLDVVTAVLTADPAAGRTRPTARAELVGAYEVVARVGDHEVVTDQRRPLGGADAGPSPIALTLAALGTCQAMTYRLWSERLGITFDHLTVTVEADFDPRTFLGVDGADRAGVPAIRVEVGIVGPEPERYPELRVAVDDHCPVLDTLVAGVPVSTRLV